MNYGLIKNGVCVNIAVFDQEADQELFSDICDEIVLLAEGFGIGDYCRDGTWSKTKSQTPIELREQAYETMTTKSDGTGLIPWEDSAITVDQANKVYLEYSAEGSGKAAAIQVLIVAAKTYIRELYPDSVG
jgi:hypothetical protein